MKPLYKITVILFAVLIQYTTSFAGGTNTNSPTNTSTKATIKAVFSSNNLEVEVSNYKPWGQQDTLIEQVILNFENGDQQSFPNLAIKTKESFTGSGVYNNMRIIGVWVKRGGNAQLTVNDSSGYGHYIQNPDAFAHINPLPAGFHDYQTDIGIAQHIPKCTDPSTGLPTPSKVLICHVPPGNPDNRHTIYVSCNAIPAHLEHHGGDSLGECGGDDPGGVIPVDMISFNAKVITPEIVELKWATASEVNNDYFSIERTADLTNWEPVCKVHGKGNSQDINHYSCTDSSAGDAGQGTLYYRPKQVDFNGTYEYFNIIKLRLENSNLANSVESVYPNPATDRLNIQYQATENGLVSIRLFTIEGKLVLTSNYTAKEGSQVVDINLQENELSKGLYLLEVESDGNVHRQKIYKQ